MKSMTIEIDGASYMVLDDLGWQPSAGMYCKEVQTDHGPKKAVKPEGRGLWRFWTIKDRIGFDPNGAK